MHSLCLFAGLCNQWDTIVFFFSVPDLFSTSKMAAINQKCKYLCIKSIWTSKRNRFCQKVAIIHSFWAKVTRLIGIFLTLNPPCMNFICYAFHQKELCSILLQKAYVGWICQLWSCSATDESFVLGFIGKLSFWNKLTLKRSRSSVRQLLVNGKGGPYGTETCFSERILRWNLGHWLSTPKNPNAAKKSKIERTVST